MSENQKGERPMGFEVHSTDTNSGESIDVFSADSGECTWSLTWPPGAQSVNLELNVKFSNGDAKSFRCQWPADTFLQFADSVAETAAIVRA